MFWRSVQVIYNLYISFHNIPECGEILLVNTLKLERVGLGGGSPTMIYQNASEEVGKKILLNVGKIPFLDFFCTNNTLRPNRHILYLL